MVRAQARGLTPELARERCPRYRTVKATCRRCAEVCPTGAIELEGPPELTIARCTGCLACAAVCPTGAFFQDRLRLPTAGGTLRLSCCVVDSSSPLPCLAGLSWQTVAEALRFGVGVLEVRVGDCETCANRPAVEARDLQQLVLQVAEGLGVEPLRLSVVRQRSAPANPKAALSRRRWLTSLLRQSPSRPEDPFLWRDGAWLPALPVGDVEKVGCCFFCPTCSQACPSRALWVESGRLMFDGSRCNGCGACADACGFGALRVHPRARRGVVELAHSQERSCSRCGERFTGEGQVCPRCWFQEHLWSRDLPPSPPSC